MTPEQIEALQAVLRALTPFAFGPITPTTPYAGLVTLTADQYHALAELVS